MEEEPQNDDEKIVDQTDPAEVRKVQREFERPYVREMPIGRKGAE